MFDTDESGGYPLSRNWLLKSTMGRRLVHNLHRIGLVRWSDKPFILKSGIPSNVYVFGREDLTDNPDVLLLLGNVIARAVHDVLLIDANDARHPCIIGIPTAGTALAAAAALCNEGGFAFRVMREMKKTHGAHDTWVNGKPDIEKHLYATVDNVVTDGKTKFETIERLAEDGYPAKTMPHLILVDRQQGGIEVLRKEGLRVIPLLNLLDLVFAFGEAGLWPKERVNSINVEIATHRAAA